MDTSATAAAWFLPAVLPICLWVGWSDLATMKIPNKAVVALVVAFAVLGLFALPLPDWGWRWSHLAVILVIGFVLNAVGMIGAGDAKFAAAAAPFVARGDLGRLVMIYIACLLACFVLHRIAKYSGLRRLAPNWESWNTGKRFPMGLPLAATLSTYLVLALLAA